MQPPISDFRLPITDFPDIMAHHLAPDDAYTNFFTCDELGESIDDSKIIELRPDEPLPRPIDKFQTNHIKKLLLFRLYRLDPVFNYRSYIFRVIPRLNL
jgi:hypothetical protein